MRLVDLPRTSSFRLALRFLILFGVASFVLFGFLYWQTNHYIIGRIDAWLAHEQTILRPLDRDTLVQRLTAHVVADPTFERPATLFDPVGMRLAGTPLSLTGATLAGMPQDVPMEFGLQQDHGPMRFRAVVHRRPSGDYLVVALDMDAQHAFADVLVNAFIWGGLITALIGLAGAAFIGAGAVRRIDGVTRAIQRIVNGDLSERLPTHGQTDDLDRLAIVINGMLGEIERLMQEVKGVCDNIAHDLRTPLTRLLAGMERMRRRAVSTEDYAAAVDDAILETKDVLNTFAAILRISEVESGARRAGFTETDISEVVADAVEFYEPVAEAKGVQLVHLTPEDAPVTMRGDPSLLFEAVGNLVDNALKFTPRGGQVTVCGFARAGTIGFEVTDTGPGIPADEAACVLRRFYRAESSRNTPGSGLGLALVAAVARLHGMDLAISDARPGCRITIARHEPVFGSPDVPISGAEFGHDDAAGRALAEQWVVVEGAGKTSA
ncbi:HAMP domain-containing sensor histidine kinase [Acidisphaera sp. S103]|uniref:sensor histidine kinase n=1 Tax=Acidisphaera sp. S103 TaxID=1747223 RepID=UPI00131D47DC|nr:ATP-binding protein [Acidisphaera sp. S103]